MQRGRGVRPFLFEHQREQGVEQIERRILRLVVAQHADALRGVALLAVRIGKAIRGQRQERRVLRLDLLPRGDAAARVARLLRLAGRLASSVARAQPR